MKSLATIALLVSQTCEAIKMVEFSRPAEEVTVLWHVSPDYGELDDYVVNRELDSANGEKKSGWTNPLGWTDEGGDDDKVLM